MGSLEFHLAFSQCFGENVILANHKIPIRVVDVVNCRSSAAFQPVASVSKGRCYTVSPSMEGVFLILKDKGTSSCVNFGNESVNALGIEAGNNV